MATSSPLTLSRLSLSQTASKRIPAPSPSPSAPAAHPAPRAAPGAAAPAAAAGRTAAAPADYVAASQVFFPQEKDERDDKRKQVRPFHSVCTPQTMAADDDRRWMFTVDPGTAEVRVVPLLLNHGSSIKSNQNNSKNNVFAVLRCSPSLRFQPCKLALNRARTHLLVCGDRGCAVIPITARVEHAVSSLSAKQGLTNNKDDVDGDDERRGSVSVRVHCTHQCDVLLSRRPSLCIVDAQWHPLSSEHVVCLFSDGIVRMYDIKRPTAVDDVQHPEQVVSLPERAAKACGMCFAPALVKLGSKAVSVEKSSKKPRRRAAHAMARHWQALTVFVVCTDGSVYGATPFLPYNAHVPRRIFEDLAHNARHNVHHAGDQDGHGFWDTVETWLDDVQTPVNRVGYHTTRKPERGSLAAGLVPKFVQLATPMKYRSETDTSRTSGGTFLPPMRFAVTCVVQASAQNNNHVLCLVRASATGMMQMFLAAADAIFPSWEDVNDDEPRLLIEYPEIVELGIGLDQSDFDDIDSACTDSSEDEDDASPSSVQAKVRPRRDFAFRPTRPPLATVAISHNDRGFPDVLVRHALGVHRVFLAWLPHVNSLMGQDEDTPATDLPEAGVECLVDSHPLEFRGARRPLLQMPLAVEFVFDLSPLGSEMMLVHVRPSRVLVMRAPGAYFSPSQQPPLSTPGQKRVSGPSVSLLEAAEHIKRRLPRYDFPKSQAEDFCTPQSLGLLLDAISRLRDEQVVPIRRTYEAIAKEFDEQKLELADQVQKLQEVDVLLRKQRIAVKETSTNMHAAFERQERLRLRTSALLRRLAHTAPVSTAERSFISEIRDHAGPTMKRLHARLEECESLTQELAGSAQPQTRSRKAKSVQLDTEDVEELRRLLESEQALLLENKRMVEGLRQQRLELEI